MSAPARYRKAIQKRKARQERQKRRLRIHWWRHLERLVAYYLEGYIDKEIAAGKYGGAFADSNTYTLVDRAATPPRTVYGYSPFSPARFLPEQGTIRYE